MTKDNSETFDIEYCKPNDWTCPNCGHESPIRTFEILERQQKKIDELENYRTINTEINKGMGGAIEDFTQRICDLQQKLQAAEERERILREAVEYYKWATIGDLEENDMVQLREKPNIWANGKRARQALGKVGGGE